MQKKIRSSKSRSKYRDFFWFAIICCVFGAILNSLLFYKSFFRALTKINEEPIATITFKYKVAQRKFIDRVVWDRLRENSPVYNGDTIHTQALSEATVWFIDGNVMELDENTMAQVFLSKTDGVGANLTQGNATVDASDSDNNFTISSYGVQAVVASGSSVSAAASNVSGEALDSKTNVSMKVLKGNAELQTKEGASKIYTGEGISFDAEGTATQTPLLVVMNPSANEKILYFNEDECEVQFKWTEKNLLESSKLNLVVSLDKDFNKIVSQQDVTGLNEAKVFLTDGVYYWSLKANTESAFPANQNSQVQARGKFTVNRSISPELVTPVSDYEYSYRNRKPAVRFIWHESKYASSYRLTVATDKAMTNLVIDQRTSSLSSIISSLGEGVYYWQVTPFYSINKIGLASPSSINSFVISRKGQMKSPELFLPSDKGIVDTDSEGKGANFSWKDDKEAVYYTIRIADNPEFKNIKIVENTDNNYISFTGAGLARKNIKDGTWYWSVTQTDDEGNISELSEVRSFIAMKGKPLLRAIEPVDGFQVAEALVRDLNLTWKKNIPDFYVTRFQISKSENFSRKLYDEIISANKYKGINLPKGEYFWRIIASSKLDDSVLETETRMIKVVDNLAAPELVGPIGRAVARETVPYKFEWKDVDGADFYRFSIYKSSDDSLVYSDNVYGNTAEVNMYGNKWIDKANYYFQVQPQSMAIPGISSRRNGNLSKSEFQLLKLRPVEIVSPARNKQYAGIDAIMNPPTISWRSVEKCKTAQIVVRKKGTDEIVFVYPDSEKIKSEKIAPQTVKITTQGQYGLRAGDYEIIVYAETYYGVDISNTDEKYIGKFTVLPIPPLDEAQNLMVNPKELNRDYIIENRSTLINFSWSKVHNATEYYFRILNSKNEVLISEILGTTGYVLDWTKIDSDVGAKLKTGTWVWSVEAIRRMDLDKDGILDVIIQEGKISKDEFITDIPTPKKSKTKGAKNPYGK